jgi:fatty-acyl-CoA synthase
LLRHRAIVNTPRFYALGFGLDSGGVWLNPFPLFHVGGWVCGTLAPAWLRMNQVLPSRIEPGLLLDLVESERVSCAIFVPTMVLDMLNHPDFAAHDLSSLTFINCGSTAVAPELVRRVEREMGCEFTVAFGQTEASGVITQSVASDSAEDKASTIGRPLAHAAVRIVDLATGEVAPVGAVGEICVRGYQVMAGYYQMPDATAAAIDSDGFLHTGDLGTMDARGYLTIAGRIKDMIIRGAENVYPQEVEYRLVEHPAVVSAAVVGVPDERLGESVAAVVTFDPALLPPTAKDLVAWCRETLSTIKVPTCWYATDRLPMTASSKVQKPAVAEGISRGAYSEIV